MWLKKARITNFRSCLDTEIEFAEHLTLLVGENDAGKSNIIDAVRFAVPPASGRPSYFDAERDLSYGAPPDSEIRVCRTYGDLTLGEDALFAPALVDAHRNLVHTAVYRTDRAVPRRRRFHQLVGECCLADPEPENRERIAHVYLPPLRDAAAALDSADGNRLADIFELVASDGDIDSFEASANRALESMASDGLARKAVDAIQSQLTSVTRPVRHHVVDVRHRGQRMRRLVRALRLHMAAEGMVPSDLLGSGLGYANLLYIASVVLELERARDFDLLLLLVEEPEAHLHPQLQSVLLSYLRSQAEASVTENDPESIEPAGRIQVIASTHSPQVASAVSTGNVVVVTNRTAEITPPGLCPEPSAEDGIDESGSGDDCASEVEESEAIANAGDAGRRASSVATALANIRLSPADRRKIDRYIDATRAALLFARQVVLVEGIAEALLLRSFAERIVFPISLDSESDEGMRNRRLREQFRAITVIAIDGVDFQPYLRLLLPSDDVSLVDRVVVVTDGDDGAGDARRTAIESAFTAHVQSGCLSVHVGTSTLEAEMYACDSNEELLREAFAAQHPRSLTKWDSLVADENVPSDQRAEVFSRALKEKMLDLGKGDFAHVVAQLIEQSQPPTAFAVPQYLMDAIRAATLTSEFVSVSEAGQ